MIPSNTTFLIIDDVPSITTMLDKQLKKYGIATENILVDCYQDAIDAIDANADLKSFQFILCDWHLPDGVGIDILRHVRKNPDFMNIPFMMVTTESEVSNMIDAVNEGASNYLIKPWEENELFRKLDLCWERHHPEAAKKVNAGGGFGTSQVNKSEEATDSSKGDEQGSDGGDESKDKFWSKIFKK